MTAILEVPITEEWLKQTGFKLEDSRNDARLPLRRLVIGFYLNTIKQLCYSPDDLCIDVAHNRDGEWFCWIMQVEPYRHIHVRTMRFTWEIEKLAEGLCGRSWGEIQEMLKERMKS